MKLYFRRFFRKINPQMFRKSLLIFVLIISFAVGVSAQQKLLMIGGGERPASVLTRLAEKGGGENGRMLVITWASGEPQASFDAFRTDVEKVSKIRLEAAPFAPLDDAAKRKFGEQLKTATGVFFTGGDQNRIMDVLKDENLLKILTEKYDGGTIFGGTSAGTAIMSKIMITGEGDFKVIDGGKVETRDGLGFLPQTIVDQHFIVRQRQNRLFGLVLKNPALLGIGIDEDTAFYVEDNRFGEVLGDSQVMIVEAQKSAHELRIILLKPNEKFDLRRKKRRN